VTLLIASRLERGLFIGPDDVKPEPDRTGS